MDQTLAGKVLSYIHRQRLLTGGEKVLVALSGGPDSVALLRILLELQSQLEVELEAVHVNHMLRGRHSAEDEEFVRRLCRRLRLSLKVVCRPARPLRGNLEDQLRRLRYDALARVAWSRQGLVATGHQLDDQAETLLLKLFRGAGPTGLSGIFATRTHILEGEGKIRVIRPLLECSRDEILRYLALIKQDFREDMSNLDLDLNRNWIRHKLLPQVSSRINPQVRRALGRSAALALEARQLLQAAAAPILAAAREDGGDVVLNVKQLKKLPTLVQKEVLRTVAGRLTGTLKGLSQDHIAAVQNLLEGASGRQVQLPTKLTVRREFEEIRFTECLPKVAGFEYRMPVPGKVWVAEVSRCVEIQAASVGDSGWMLYLQSPFVTIRNRRPGDRLKLACGRDRKLKRLFQQRRIPLSKRDRLICVEVGGRLIWVETLGPDLTDIEGLSRTKLFRIEIGNETFGA